MAKRPGFPDQADGGAIGDGDVFIGTAEGLEGISGDFVDDLLTASMRRHLTVAREPVPTRANVNADTAFVFGYRFIRPSTTPRKVANLLQRLWAKIVEPIRLFDPLLFGLPKPVPKPMPVVLVVPAHVIAAVANRMLQDARPKPGADVIERVEIDKVTLVLKTNDRHIDDEALVVACAQAELAMRIDDDVMSKIVSRLFELFRAEPDFTKVAASFGWNARSLTRDGRSFVPVLFVGDEVIVEVERRGWTKIGPRFERVRMSAAKYVMDFVEPVPR